MVPEKLPIKQLLMVLLGAEGRVRLGNQTKPNSHTAKSFYEAKRLLEKFRAFLGGYLSVSSWLCSF